MNGKDIELSRRRVLGGIATVGAASAAAGAGTFAYFSDTETSDGNTITADTLDLTTSESSSITSNIDNAKPGDTGALNLVLNKEGGVAADLSVEVTDVSSAEKTPDTVDGDSDDSNSGELDDQVEVELWIGQDGGEDTDLDQSGDPIVLNTGGNSDDTGASNPELASSYANESWSNVIEGFSGPVTFNAEWKFLVDDESSVEDNNDAQGDDLSITFEFTLEQQS